MRAKFVNEVMGFERSDDIKVSLQLGKRAQITKWLDTMGVKKTILLILIGLLMLTVMFIYIEKT